MTTRPFDSIAALMDAHDRGELDSVAFNDELWQMLADLIESPADAARYGAAPLAYFASQYLQYEVGNGGFAQAAFNIPEWFETAAWGYECLGLTKAAALIREAIPLLAEENAETTFDADDIGELFEQFAESRLAKLDARLDECGWWATEARLRFVREHAEAFRAIA